MERNFPGVQWLKPHAFTAVGIKSIPGLEPRSHLQLGMAKKKKSVWMKVGEEREKEREEGSCNPNFQLGATGGGHSLAE